MPVVGEEAAHIPFSVGEDTEIQNYQKVSTIKLNLNVCFSCANIKGAEHPKVQKGVQPFRLRASELSGGLLYF